MLHSLLGYTQKSSENEIQKPKLFIAYDLGQAAFNKMQSLLGEIGLSLPNKDLIRLVPMPVKCTEEHMSSDFAVTVAGDNLAGSMFGFEGF